MNRTTSPATGPHSVRLERGLVALHSPLRRAISAELLRHFQPVQFVDLRQFCHQWERDRRAKPYSLECVHEELTDTHLPVLREAGLIAEPVDGHYSLSSLGLAVERVQRSLDDPDSETMAAQRRGQQNVHRHRYGSR